MLPALILMRTAVGTAAGKTAGYPEHGKHHLTCCEGSSKIRYSDNEKPFWSSDSGVIARMARHRVAPAATCDAQAQGLMCQTKLGAVFGRQRNSG